VVAVGVVAGVGWVSRRPLLSSGGPIALPLFLLAAERQGDDLAKHGWVLDLGR
jgi:hypothetical protein